MIPKEGSRVKVKSLGLKGTIFYIHNPTLFLDDMSPIQVELDKAYEEHSKQRMYRTSLKDIKPLKKKKAEGPKEMDMDFIKSVNDLVIGKEYMIFIKKKYHIEPTMAKIIKVTDEGVRCYLTHQKVTKKKVVPSDRFLKQRKRFEDEFKNQNLKKARIKTPKVATDEEEIDFSLV